MIAGVARGLFPELSASSVVHNALDVINAMTSKEAVTDYSLEAVEAILSAFNDRVLQAIHDEDNPSRPP